MKRDYNLYLEDILNCIDKIEKYTKDKTFEDFCSDEKTIDAVIRNLEIIGEASKKIPKSIKSKNPEIPWDLMEGMRNILIHEYFGVKLDIIWKTIKEKLPQLKVKIKDLINNY